MSAGAHGDLPLAEAVGVAEAVGALVVVAHEARRLAEGLEQARADVGVRAHDLHLRRG